MRAEIETLIGISQFSTDWFCSEAQPRIEVCRLYLLVTLPNATLLIVPKCLLHTNSTRSALCGNASCENDDNNWSETSVNREISACAVF